jgi:hypothetical protein
MFLQPCPPLRASLRMDAGDVVLHGLSADGVNGAREGGPWPLLRSEGREGLSRVFLLGPYGRKTKAGC